MVQRLQLRKVKLLKAPRRVLRARRLVEAELSLELRPAVVIQPDALESLLEPVLQHIAYRIADR